MGKKMHSTTERSRIERLEGCQKNVSAWACDHAHCCLSLCPVNWNTKQSEVDGRAVLLRRIEVQRRGGWVCCLSPATLNLHSSLGIDCGASKRDRHTVTVKMNCHLAFLNLLAASNWPLWTMWRDTDWVRPPPPSPLLGSWGRSSFNLECSGSPFKASRQGLVRAKAASIAPNMYLSPHTFHGFSILSHHPSLFLCTAWLRCLSAGLVFLTAYSHGGLTGTEEENY